jgi:hypothetical protein
MTRPTEGGLPLKLDNVMSKKRRQKFYIVIYNDRTDEGVIIRRMTKQEIFNHEKEVTRWDYAVIEGIVVKDFDGALSSNMLDRYL